MTDRRRKRFSTNKRLAIAFWVISLLLIICLVQSVLIVAKNRDEYVHNALSQATGNPSSIVARPGNILDRNGSLLAAAEKVYRLILDPKVMAETESAFPGSLDVTAGIVAEAFGLNKTEIMDAFGKDPSLSYLRFGGETLLTEEQMAAYEKAAADFKAKKAAENEKSGSSGKKITAKVTGVWFETEYRRVYPMKDLLSKVVGYTTKDAKTGVTGLALQYGDALRGVDGKQYYYLTEEGYAKEEVMAPTDGYTLVTSLDANVAKIVKDCIAGYMEEMGGERVNVLVMNPNNGEVIAMVSDTDFDLNNPSDLSGLFTVEELSAPGETFLLKEAYKGRTEQLEAMTEEEQLLALRQQVQLNYAVSGTYEPGSTAKALTLSAGIERGLIDPEETFYCDGEIQVGKYTIHCHICRDTFCGELKPIEALGRSCNVAFVRIAEQIGVPVFTAYQEIFNLGQKTGIDLPGEANTSRLIYREDNMNEIELSTCSFGQGFNVTMIQLAAAYASIINGGYYYQPHVVKQILDANGNTVEEKDPVLVRRTISESTSAYMKEALQYVVENGTASYIELSEFSMAGKTGAAEKLPRGTGKYVVSFIGTSLLKQPEYLLYVVIDEPNEEDQSMSMPAQLLAHSIFEKLNTYYRVFPESAADPYTYDWSSLREFDAASDSQGTEGFIEDPEGEIPWIAPEENPIEENGEA